MKQRNITRLTGALGLTRKVVGVRFLYSWADYEDSKGEDYSGKTTFCMMVKKASEGYHYKCCPENFGCDRSRMALGIDAKDMVTCSGEVFYACNLYASRAIAKQAQEGTLFINQHLYGIEIAPLENLSDADVVIFLANAYQMMRVVQGYAYQFGTMKNIGTVGNQGICSDLCARPFETNDINISFLCEGARRVCQWSCNDIGVGMPVNRFDAIVEGVIATLNLIEKTQNKEEILSRIDEETLDLSIDPEAYYGISYRHWLSQTKEKEQRYLNHLNELAKES